MNEDKKKALREAAEFGAEYFTALIEQGLTRNDAMDMANNFALMYLVTTGVIKIAKPDEPKEPWQK